MSPEQVLASLVAHASTVDFRRPDPLVIAARPDLKPSQGPQTALGKQFRSINKDQLHVAAMDALAGMPDRYWQVLQVAIGIDSKAREKVFNRLMRTAMRSRQRDPFWPEKVERRRVPRRPLPADDYTADLVELAIMHLEDPDSFNVHWKRAEWFGLSESRWKTIMQKPFDVVSAQLWAWYSAGFGHMQRGLARRRETA